MQKTVANYWGRRKQNMREDEMKGIEEERKIIENVSCPVTVECS
jgi:hypothetical protein